MLAVAFRAGLANAEILRNRLIAWSHQFPVFGWLFPVAFGAAGAMLSILLVRRYSPEAAGSGIPHLEAVLHRRRTMSWLRVLITKFFSGLIAIGSGMALGREGPTVQMGGAAGMGVARMFKMNSRETLTMTAAGAGAGLAAAFNAPLSGLIFVLEELQRDFRPTVFGAAFLAAACADVVTRLFAGQIPDFAVPAYPTPVLALLPAFAVLGGSAGLLGIVFNRSLLGSLNGFAALGGRWNIVSAGAVGCAVGLAGYWMPAVIGGGHGLAETILADRFALAFLPILFLVRFGLTMACYGCGAPGGIFAPLLVLGALIGLMVGKCTLFLFPHVDIQPGAFAVVGMAAYFTAIVRAPLTGIVLIIEMTQSYALMLPLLIACFCAYTVPEIVKDMPIYEALLQRDLLKGGTSIQLEEPIVVEYEVEPGAPFDGRTVRQLGLPSGVVLVECRDREREWVPTADTIVAPHMRLTAVVAPDSEGGMQALRDGCRSRP
jgi:CIC family chloride channel protein